MQSASDSAKGCVARLAGAELPSWPDTEASFAELQTRVARTLDFVGSFAPDQIYGSEERKVVLKFRTGEVTFDGQGYLIGFAIPNFYFHVTTAYAILRHNGVDIGKIDYLRGF